jgi:hypothetical protein
VAIWTIKMTPGAQWTLPAATGEGTRRMLYFFKGATALVGGQRVQGPVAIELRAGMEVELVNGPDEASEFLVLQGRPIAEPVVQYGPFVMNTQAEISQTMADYRRTQFGGWPFDDTAPVHGRETGALREAPGRARGSADGLNLLNGPDSPDGRVRGSSAPRRPAPSCSG